MHPKLENQVLTFKQPFKVVRTSQNIFTFPKCANSQVLKLKLVLTNIEVEISHKHTSAYSVPQLLFVFTQKHYEPVPYMREWREFYFELKGLIQTSGDYHCHFFLRSPPAFPSLLLFSVHISSFTTTALMRWYFFKLSGKKKSMCLNVAMQRLWLMIVVH